MGIRPGRGDPMPNNELYHYGILGMKWGVRRFQRKDGTRTALGKQHERNSEKSSKPKHSIRKIASNIRETIAKKDKENENDKRNHDRIIKEAKRTGKSAAQIEQEEEQSGKKLKLTSNQKKAIAIGAVAAAAALTAYGVYKYNQISKDKNSVSPPPIPTSNANKEYGKSGDTDFLHNAFSGHEYRAYDNTQSDKKAVNDLLTASSGTWWKRLSKAEKKAVEDYTGNAYAAMNKALWTVKGGDISKYPNKEVVKKIKAIDSALQKASFPETMVVTQGLTTSRAAQFLGISQSQLIDAAQNPELAKSLIGKVNTNYGLCSTTTCSNGGFMGGVKYKILTPKGAHAQYIEHISDFGDNPHPPSWDGKSSGGPPFSKEFETLFAAGSKFATRGIQMSPEGHIEIALEYVFDEIKK